MTMTAGDAKCQNRRFLCCQQQRRAQAQAFTPMFCSVTSLHWLCVPPIHRLTAVFLWHRCNFAGYIIEAQLAVFFLLLFALQPWFYSSEPHCCWDSSMQGGRIWYNGICFALLCRSGIFLLGCSALVSSGNVPRDRERPHLCCYSALVRLTILPVIGCSRASGAAPSSINHRGGAGLFKCRLDRTFFCRN